MKRALTTQQQRAVRTRNVSVVLSSGAGCGKTHVLTERYLSHLRDGEASVSQLVAITFTERAAREMRDRIRKGMSAAMRQARAEEAEQWAGHLQDLETAPIGTIHSFCGNLIRQHAVHVGLDPRFEVLEEMFADNLRSDSMRTTLRALLTSATQAGDDLRELIVLYGWNAVLAALDHLLGQVDPRRWEDWLRQKPADVEKAWRETDRQELLTGWVDYLIAGSPAVAGCLNLLKTTPCLLPEMRLDVERILTETPQLAGAPDLAAAIAELKECAKVGRGKKAKDAWANEEIYQAVKDAFEGFRTLPEKLALFTDIPENLLAAVEYGQRFIRVAAELAGAYRARKRRAGAVDFEDLLVLARDLLRDSSEVRESLRERFQFLLLDELQDTDPVQMELVELLCGVGLHRGKLFAVGDHKQSIYRFRGADVSLFRKLRSGVHEDGRLDLSRNFRSQPGILHFVNALCSRRMVDYIPLEAEYPKVQDRPVVEFLWSVPGSDGDGGKKDKSLQLRQRDADSVARRIVKLLDDPHPCVYESESKTLRRIETADVVLLFRAMSNVVIYETALRRHGLDYYLVGGRAFYAQQEIFDLLNLLRTLENPEDSLSLAGTLRSPFCGLSDETLYVLGTHRAGLWAGLNEESLRVRVPDSQRDGVDRARRFLNRWRDRKDRVAIAQLLQDIFADSGFDAAVQFEFLGDRKLANLWKLIDLARSFDHSGIFGLADFIHRLGELVYNQPREEQAATLPESAAVIRLMSIHQAKGLEFPVVFIPDLAFSTRDRILPSAHWHRRYGCLVRPPADEQPAPFSALAWELGQSADKIDEWQEDLRILYVACTRARDRLILSAGLPEAFPVSTAQPIKVKSLNAWMFALSERFHLGTGACIAADVSKEAIPEVLVHSVEPPDRADSGYVAPREPEIWSGPVRAKGNGRFASALPSVISLPLLDRLTWWMPEGEFDPRRLNAVAFDAEEGLEDHEWRSPRARMFGDWRHPHSALEAMLWRILSRWDFRDPAGWRHWLSDALGSESASVANPRKETLGTWLTTFAESSLRSELADAKECRREVKFLLAGEAAMKSAGAERIQQSQPMPVLWGMIDFLWTDAAGNRHLLAIDMGEEAGCFDAWPRRHDELILQAFAAREQFGQSLRTFGLWDLSAAQLVQADARKLDYGPPFARLESKLVRLCSRTHD